MQRQLSFPLPARLTNWINGVDEDPRDGGVTPAEALVFKEVRPGKSSLVTYLLMTALAAATAIVLANVK